MSGGRIKSPSLRRGDVGTTDVESPRGNPGISSAPGRRDDRYLPAIAGFIQPVGLHHGFHTERIAPDSAAAKHSLQPHDVIVSVDGEVLRHLDHLQVVLVEAYADDGMVTITYIRGGWLAHHDLQCNVEKVTTEAVGRKAKADEEIR